MHQNKLLIVDDEKIILAAWEEELKHAGYDVKTALKGKKAVELVRHEKPDFVITDLVMPEMNGVEVCKIIKKMYPDIEVVFISGHPAELEKNLMAFIKVGGREEFLRTPLLKDEL
jgi:CheY-like chemotaxis protein